MYKYSPDQHDMNVSIEYIRDYQNNLCTFQDDTYGMWDGSEGHKMSDIMFILQRKIAGTWTLVISYPSCNI